MIAARHDRGERFQVVAAGANVIVSGSGIYGTKDYAATIAAMRQRGNAAAAR